MKKIIIAAFFSSITVLFIFYWPAEKRGRVCFESFCFDVELALTAEKQARGLMFIEKLGENEGMLFVFKEDGEYSFWMKNTTIPLDIIWLNKDKEVVFIGKNARPCEVDQCPLIGSDEPAQYVLELNAGTADRIGLRVGDKMSF